ncbi:hypothetical protein KUH32_05950 [Thalassococcus sp. CAU 1522]|uniref:Uncharacterized protein n=1 Tax=Thalassococcus arenae TaxID=2851652 RepID=A0ABS6N5K8_9RHOB|nr:hypothetical protein [Thalassococcus arenae]MBV2359306.1 hypothetical protein [Thalassococcus arenae]
MGKYGYTRKSAIRATRSTRLGQGNTARGAAGKVIKSSLKKKVGPLLAFGVGFEIGKYLNYFVHMADDLSDRIFKARHPKDPRSTGKMIYKFKGDVTVTGDYVPWTVASDDAGGRSSHPGLFRREDQIGARLDALVNDPGLHKAVEGYMRKTNPVRRRTFRKPKPATPKTPAIKAGTAAVRRRKKVSYTPQRRTAKAPVPKRATSDIIRIGHKYFPDTKPSQSAVIGSGHYRDPISTYVSGNRRRIQPKPVSPDILDIGRSMK